MKLQVETCCEQHDRAYSAGSLATRADADRALYDCIACERPKFAWVVWAGVRTFGWLFYKR